MEKLEKSLQDNSPNFIHLYHLTIEKIRKFYHNLNGPALIQTSKVYRLYTDEKYRHSFCGYDVPDDEFINLYLDAITDTENPLEIKLEKLKKLYNYAKRDISLENEYRILIKSRNKK